MPIRLCQKCGLKVLIDESQAGTSPFYCQRCTTAMKGQESAGPAPGPLTPPRNATPSPVSPKSDANAATATGSGGALKAATVRVLCPYCKASFNGRVPAKPARGSCPVCQKELILLPDGDIKPAAGFDISTWQPGAAATPPEAPVESNTKLLVKKYAAESPAIAPPPALKPVARKMDIPAPTPSPVAPASDTDVSELPSWLDDGKGGSSGSAPVEPPDETSVEDIDLNDPKNDLSKPPPPPPRRLPLAGKPPARPPAPVRAPEPEPEPVPTAQDEIDLLPPPVPAPARPPALNRSSGTRRAVAAPAPVAAAPASGGSGKTALAVILLLLPLVGGAVAFDAKDKLKHEQVTKLGQRFSKGLVALHLKIFPPPPPPKVKVEEKAPEPEPVKVEPPKADPDQQKKDGLAISHLFNETLQLKRNYKQLKVAATDEQKGSLAEIQRKIDGNEARIKQMRESYQKMYGTDYDPEK